jgi:cyclophilin family peptidyl-prolyl cis-trans isomerase
MRHVTSKLTCTSVLLALCLGCDGAARTPSQAGPAAAATDSPPLPPPSATADISATFEQASGSIRIRLAAKEAPRLTMSFILLAESGYFTGRTWTDFSPVVRQTGDSTPIYTLPREFSPKLLFDAGGRLCASNTTEDASARAKPNRIFITVKEQDRWNLVYSVFGVVTDGLDVARNMRDGEPITAVRIEGDTAALRTRFAREIPEWSAQIETARK